MKSRPVLCPRVLVGLSLGLVCCTSKPATPPPPPDAGALPGPADAGDASLEDAGAPADGGGDPPDSGQTVSCRSGRDWALGAAAFQDSTERMGLSAPMDPINVLATADVDGDGYADLILLDTTTNARKKSHLFLNRPTDDGLGRRFVEASESSGFFRTRGDDVDGRVSSLVSFGDVDNDGDVDAMSAFYRDRGQFDWLDRGEILLNDGSGHFSLAESPPPAHEEPTTSSLAFFDQDLDGVLDLYLTYWYEQPPFQTPFGMEPQVLRGDGFGGFTDVTHEVGIALTRTRAGIEANTALRPLFGGTVCDVNGDGRADLLGATYGRGLNLLYLADRERFREIGLASGVAADDRRDPSDDQSYRCYCQGGAERCNPRPPAPARGYPCPGRGWYPGDSDQPWSLGGNTFSIACADVDNDGDQDLYTGEIRHPDVGSSSDPSELLLNDGAPGDPRFSRPGRDTMGLRPPLPVTADEGGQNNGIFDFDGDGWLDLYLGGSPYEQNKGWLFHQKSPGAFEWVGPSSGFNHDCPHGMAIADFDHDGDQDVVVGTYGCGAVWGTIAPVRYYENIAAEHNFISVRLVGGGRGAANGSGIGAMIRVTAGGITQTHELRGSWGRAALSMDLVAHFGLGAACQIDEISVRWPDRAHSTQVFRGVAANQRVELRQGDDQVHPLP